MKHAHTTLPSASLGLRAAAFAAVGVGLALACALAGCSFGRATNALYIYMCGSTLETKAGAGSKNIDELLRAQIPPSTNVVIQTGGSTTWRDHDIPSDSLNRYVIDEGKLQLVESLDNASMGKSETLEDFLAWCERDYPAEQEVLVFWDHGEGADLTFCYDENFGMDPLTTQEVAAAFDGSGAAFDLIGLDVCLTASLDLASFFEPYTPYLVASQDIEPSGGWDYQALVESLGTSNEPLEIGRTICDTYLAKCQESQKDAFATLSVMDLSKVGAVQVAFEEFAQDLTSAAKAEDSNFSVASASGRAMAFGANSPAEGYSNMIDLWGFANTIYERSELASAKALCNALETFVPHSVAGSNRNGAKGVSLYYPTHYDAQKLADYLGVSSSQRYKTYLDAVYGEVPASTIGFIDTGSKAQDGSFQIQLTPESRPYLRAVDFYLLELVGDDPTHPRVINQLGSDSDVAYDWDTLTFNSNFRGMWPALEGVSLNSTFIGNSGEDLLFTAPVLVNGKHTNLRFSYVFNQDEGGHYEILGLFDGLDEYALAAKEVGSLEPGDEVVVLTQTLDGKTQGAELEAGETVVIGEDGAHITEKPLQETTYRYFFVVHDIFGNVFTSKPALFEMRVTPEELTSDTVIERTYAADVVSIDDEPVAIDSKAIARATTSSSE